MTRNQFADAARQYAALALRQRRSYAAQVTALAQARMETVRQMSDGSDRDREVAIVESILTREYAPNDQAFKLPDVPEFSLPF